MTQYPFNTTRCATGIMIATLCGHQLPYVPIACFQRAPTQRPPQRCLLTLSTLFLSDKQNKSASAFIYRVYTDPLLAHRQEKKEYS